MTNIKKPYFLPYFDGLRGLAALVVFMGHIACSFYPALTSGAIDLSGLTILPKLAKTPFSIFTAANSAVCIFFVLSGYVMSMLAQRSQESFIAISCRRYLRLAGPAVVSCLFSAWLLKHNLYFNQAICEITGSAWLKLWFLFHGHYHVALKEGLIRIFQHPTSTYNSSLWTMYIELWGSFIIFAMSFLIKNKILRFIGFLTLCLVSIRLYDKYDFFCIFAGAVSFHFYQIINVRFKKEWINIFLIILGIFLCSYPDFAPFKHGGPIYNIISTSISSVWYHAVGAIIIVHFLHDSKIFISFFSSRILLWLGKISFSLYLIHLPIICSLGSLLVYLMHAYVPYNLMAPLVITVIAIVSLYAAQVYNKTVDNFFIQIGHLISRQIDKLFPTMPTNFAHHSEQGRQAFMSGVANT